MLVDARPEGPAEESLRFAQRLVRELGGVVQSRFLLGRLRSRIGAMERARVARELHDGTIQSLVGVEMEVDVLRRRADQAGSRSPGTSRGCRACCAARCSSCATRCSG